MFEFIKELFRRRKREHIPSDEPPESGGKHLAASRALAQGSAAEDHHAAGRYHDRYGRRCSREEDERILAEAEQALERGTLYRMFEVTRMPEFADAVFDRIMVNEDYYLTDQELIEYYVPGASIREYDYVEEEAKLQITRDMDGKPTGVMVKLGDDPIGCVDLVRADYVMKVIAEKRLRGAQVIFGGGRYKLVLTKDETLPWEQPVTGTRAREIADQIGEEVSVPLPESGDAAYRAMYPDKVQDGFEGVSDPEEAEKRYIRRRESPIWAFVCLAIRRGADEKL